MEIGINIEDYLSKEDIKEIAKEQISYAIKEKDRQLGLTTLMLNDCIKNGYVLLVPNQIGKKRLAYELCTKEHMMLRDAEQYLMCPSDNTRAFHRDLKIVVDNHCSFGDISEVMATTMGKIVNGFVYCPYAA